MSENSTIKNNGEDAEFDLDHAWIQMRATLDRELPVQKRNRRRIAFLWWTRMAAMLITGISIAVFTVEMYHTGSSRDKQSMVVLPIDKNNVAKQSELPKAKNSFAETTTFPNKNDDKHLSSPHSLAGKALAKRVLAHPVFITGDEILHSPAAKVSAQEAASRIPYPASIGRRNLSPVRLYPIADALTKGQVKRSRRAGVEIGLLYNSGTSASQLYPVLRYHQPLGDKLSISAGIAFNSPLAPKNFTVKEFMVLNDTTNQVYFTIRDNAIKKIVYLDLPVELHYAINKKWSVSAGVQLSISQEHSIDSKNTSYDFAADPTDRVPLIGMTGYQPYQAYTQGYSIAKQNWRLLAGASYHFGKASIRVQYQGSLTNNYQVTDFNGEKMQGRLSLVTVGAFYKF